MMTRAKVYEVWSRTPSGSLKKHGVARGLTFEDACKQLACDSLDFWMHFQRGAYQGHKLHPSETEVLSEPTEDRRAPG